MDEAAHTSCFGDLKIEAPKPKSSGTLKWKEYNLCIMCKMPIIEALNGLIFLSIGIPGALIMLINYKHTLRDHDAKALPMAAFRKWTHLNK